MFLVFAAYSGTLFDFLVGVGPKLDPISFYPHLSLPTGRDRLIQREICSLLSPTSEKHSVGLTHATVRGVPEQTGSHHGKSHGLSSPALPASVHLFDLRLCLSILVHTHAPGPDGRLIFSPWCSSLGPGFVCPSRSISCQPILPSSQEGR